LQTRPASGQFTYTYDVASRLKTQRSPNGVELTLSRGARGRLTAAELLSPAALIEQILRPLDPVRNVPSQSRPERSGRLAQRQALN